MSACSAAARRRFSTSAFETPLAASGPPRGSGLPSSIYRLRLSSAYVLRSRMPPAPPPSAPRAAPTIARSPRPSSPLVAIATRRPATFTPRWSSRALAAIAAFAPARRGNPRTPCPDSGRGLVDHQAARANRAERAHPLVAPSATPPSTRALEQTPTRAEAEAADATARPYRPRARREAGARRRRSQSRSRTRSRTVVGVFGLSPLWPSPSPRGAPPPPPRV